NLGSLLGLLAYPILIEPNLSLKDQGWLWSGGFVLFGLLVIFIAFQNRYAAPLSKSVTVASSSSERPSSALLSLWIILSATASLLLLSITNQISQEVAVIPFLWILPLTLYLLSFILTFSGESGYNRKLYLILFACSVALLMFVLIRIESVNIYLQIIAYSLLMFSACMLCHGELYLLRPDAQHLTSFYLMISVGGALGGIFASLIAPFIFNGYWEFMVALAMALALWLTALRAGRVENHAAWARFMLTVFLLITVLLSSVGNLTGILFSKRNFFGVIRVRELIPEGSTEPAYAMSHGITVHGLEFINPALRDVPTTYYIPGGGAGLALLNHPRTDKGLKVGLLGLGVGTLAAYGQPGDEYRLYEINSIVVDLAEGQGGYFSYLKDSKAHITTVLGDARISLERELAVGQPQNFDVLVLDTFSSDSIPVHLVTKEAFYLYLKHLAPDGIIAAHISNRHLDLKPVFWQIAKFYGLHIVSVDYPSDNNGGYPTEWLLLTRDPALLEMPAIKSHSVDLSGYSTNLKLWTDDYSNLFQILK
ncbi:MAG: ferrichrome ABC transporter permease, partial [Chloroflexota bacterium]